MVHDIVAHVFASVWKEHIVDKADGRGGAFDVEEVELWHTYHRVHRGKPQRAGCCLRFVGLSERGMHARAEVRRSKAERFEFRIHTAERVVGCPAGLVLEPADGADSAVGAKVEPMAGAAGDADHVSSLDLDGNDIAIQRMDVEDAASGDDE